MKRKIILLIFNFLVLTGFTQNSTIDSLFTVLKTAKEDTNKVKTLNDLSKLFFQIGKYEQSIKLAKEALKLSQKKHYKMGKANAYSIIGDIDDMQGNYTEALKNFFAALKIFQEIDNKQELANSYNDIAIVYANQGNYVKALNNFFTSLQVMKKTNNILGVADTYNNIGLMYHYQGNYPEALKNYFATLRIYEKNGDKRRIAASYNNIGMVYANQGNYPAALKKYLTSIEIRKKNGDKYGIATTYNNIGIIFHDQKDYPEALKNYFAALNIFKQLNHKMGIGNSYNVIGAIYSDQENYTDALTNYFISLKIFEEIGDKNGITASYLNIGSVYTRKNKATEAKKYLNDALARSIETGNRKWIKDVYRQLSLLDSIQGNWKAAYRHHKLYILYRDSLDNEESKEKIIQASMNYEFEKKEALTKAAQDKKDALAATEMKKQQIIRYAVSGILVLVILFTLFLYNRFRLIRKQKNIIELKERETHAQKEIIEEKHKEITDSINYAERIQRSFLATTEMLDKYLSSPWEGAEGGAGLPVPVIAGKERTKQSAASEEIASLTTFTRNDENTVTSISPKNEGISRSKRSYFVFFRPKDVVSGDFYWAGELNNGNFAFSVADSTGHGVPGAIMSILNISSLEKSIERETEPHKILNQTRRIIIDRLKKDGSAEGGKDGMDCSLFVINKDKTQLSFSMANNPVFIVRPTVIASSSTTVIASEERTKQSAALEEIASLPTVARNEDNAVTSSVRPSSNVSRSDSNYQLFEYKPDKMPVGKHEKENEPFTLHTLQLQKGDIIYALTDGFPDQFGGEKGKKYMIKNLKELLLQIAHLPMHEQEQKLAEEFTAWKGSNEQVDDVCVIGVRI